VTSVQSAPRSSLERTARYAVALTALRPPPLLAFAPCRTSARKRDLQLDDAVQPSGRNPSMVSVQESALRKSVAVLKRGKCGDCGCRRASGAAVNPAPRPKSRRRRLHGWCMTRNPVRPKPSLDRRDGARPAADARHVSRRRGQCRQQAVAFQCLVASAVPGTVAACNYRLKPIAPYVCQAAAARRSSSPRTCHFGQRRSREASRPGKNG